MSETGKKPDITVFFPVYNDEQTVRRVTEKAIRVCEEIADRYEIVIINDCSPDNSGKIADELAREKPFVKVVHHEKNRGYGAGRQIWLSAFHIRMDLLYRWRR
jgi:glycosyltransferase involved in cell wall biosynthesis